MVQPLVIAGPTASGKSALAIALAQKLDGELVCADSRQFYQGMRIGTAGPTPQEMAQVPHHLFHTFDPNDRVDAGRFVHEADQCVDTILARGKTPILVGGTGLYLRAWRFGMQDVPRSDSAIRAELLARIDQGGLQALYDELLQLDPESAQAIAPVDHVRIIRALEIRRLTGEKPSALRQSHSQQSPRREARWLLLFPQREWLKQRLFARVQQMFRDGLIDEAVALRNTIGADHELVKTMGYDEALQVYDKSMSLNDAILEVTRRHNGYAKRQMTWFQKEAWWHRVDPTHIDLAQILQTIS